MSPAGSNLRHFDVSALFKPALAQMEAGHAPAFGPCSFQGYLAEHGLSAPNTCQYISVDNLRRLAPDLRKARTMVFRLGSPKGNKHTHFALARCITGWDEYFILDKEVFADAEPQLFIPQGPNHQLFAFKLLPKFTETSLVNLAIASGLLSHALSLDDTTLPPAPATGQGTYSFTFSPNAALGLTWSHTKGQVEIDAAVIAYRRGGEMLLVIEAKVGDDFDSLAKHKLLYPVLALRGSVPDHIPVIPVYIRVLRRRDGLHFYIAECEVAGLGDGVVSLSGLRPIVVRQTVLKDFGNS
jgi:hypothetical protein